MRIPIFKMIASRFLGDRRVEADGFYEGAHRVPAEHGLAEIDARYENRRAELEKNSFPRLKDLEAGLEYLDKLAPTVERLWQGVEERTGDELPQVVSPAIIAGIGVFALLAEAKLLAPSMDVLHVTDPPWQLLTAAGLVSIACLSFHFAWESFDTQRLGTLTKWTWRLVAAAFGISLTFWGVFRGYQAAFAASVTENPLGDFLNGHPILTSIFYVFVTLGTPLAAASASHYSAHRLHHCYEYRHVKSRIDKLAKERARAYKQLQSEREQLAKGLEQLTAQCAEDKARFTQHHVRGGQFGAVQEPYWMVLLKSTLAMLIAAAVFCWLFFLMPPVYGIVLLIVWITGFIHYRRDWQSPGPEEFFENENVQYAVRAADAANADLSPIEVVRPRILRNRSKIEIRAPKELPK